MISISLYKKSCIGTRCEYKRSQFAVCLLGTFYDLCNFNTYNRSVLTLVPNLYSLVMMQNDID